jgi:autotransporter-associated beta strand protein
VTGGGRITVDGGRLVLAGANTFTGTAAVTAGELVIAHDQAIATARASVASGARLTVATAGRPSVGRLDLAAGGTIDVAAGGITAAAGLSPAAVVAALQAGRGDGTWNGSAGITSSVVAADLADGRPRTLGWIDSGDGSLTVSYAAPGDTNIDDGVDILDAANFLTGGAFDTGLPATWFAGDFNYDDVVDILDAADFFSTGLFDAGPYTAALSLTPVTAVPEPTMVSPWLALAVATVWRLQFRKR